jgi:hypothetical protein
MGQPVWKLGLVVILGGVVLLGLSGPAGQAAPAIDLEESPTEIARDAAIRMSFQDRTVDWHVRAVDSNGTVTYDGLAHRWRIQHSMQRYRWQKWPQPTDPTDVDTTRSITIFSTKSATLATVSAADRWEVMTPGDRYQRRIFVWDGPDELQRHGLTFEVTSETADKIRLQTDDKELYKLNFARKLANRSVSLVIDKQPSPQLRKAIFTGYDRRDDRHWRVELRYGQVGTTTAPPPKRITMDLFGAHVTIPIR